MKFPSMPDDVEASFALAIGYFVWSIGMLEHECIRWGDRIGGVEMKDEVIEKNGLHKKAIYIAEKLRGSALEKRYKRMNLFTKAACYHRIRNVIAHNPVVHDKSGIPWIVDANNLRGLKNKPLRKYSAKFVFRTAVKAQELANCITLQE